MTSYKLKPFILVVLSILPIISYADTGARCDKPFREAMSNATEAQYNAQAVCWKRLINDGEEQYTAYNEKLKPKRRVDNCNKLAKTAAKGQKIRKYSSTSQSCNVDNLPSYMIPADDWVNGKHVCKDQDPVILETCRLNKTVVNPNAATPKAADQPPVTPK